MRRSESKSFATKVSRKAWRAYFVSMTVPDPPYTRREQNQFFKTSEAAFLSNDRDGDGSISLSELKRAVTLLSPSTGRVEGKFRKADFNRDGVLGFGEYLELEFGG